MVTTDAVARSRIMLEHTGINWAVVGFPHRGLQWMSWWSICCG